MELNIILTSLIIFSILFGDKELLHICIFPWLFINIFNLIKNEKIFKEFIFQERSKKSL